MSEFGRELVAAAPALVDRWYAKWRESEHPHPEVSEAALRDSLEPQLRLIGEQLCELEEAEAPKEMWTVTDRLHPEERASQDVPIEEVVQEYRMVTEIVHDWADERELPVTFEESSYFYSAIFELTAESVKRYTAHQKQKVTEDRAQYLAGLTHQMRSPLSTLSLQLDVLEAREVTDADTIARFRRNVNRLSFLVNGVMRLERFQPDELPVHPDQLAIAQTIHELVEDYRPVARFKGLRLEVDVSETLEVEIDRDLFIDALGNLIDNAFKHTSSGFVRVEVDEEPSHVVFGVIDSGEGVPEERRAELFEPMAPAKTSGAGIGLHVARRAIEAQGGEIGVESTPGEGSTFWFRLPRHVQARSAETSDQNGSHASSLVTDA